MKGLVIRSPWIEKILAGTKDWEMRSKATLYRGSVALIRKGTGMAFGIADLVDSLPPLDADAFCAGRPRHGVPAVRASEVLRNGWIHPWVLQNVRRLREPVLVRQKPGAVNWVSLDADVISAITDQSEQGSALGAGIER